MALEHRLSFIHAIISRVPIAPVFFLAVLSPEMQEPNRLVLLSRGASIT
jgi:hypothetical protein